jgi:hypothetical protein
MNATDVTELRDGFGERCRQLIEAQRGKPLVKGAIDYDWNDRGNFTRKYAHSVTTFAMQAFHLNEHADVANQALQELCGHYLDNPIDLYEAHSFHWSGALYGRLWSFFAKDGSVAADRMAEPTQEILLDVMWEWSKKASVELNSDADSEQIWRFGNSENHHAMGIVTTWAFCGVLKDHDAYASRAFEDDSVAEEHYDAWSAYLKAYFRARAGKGQSVEIASKSYNAHTIQMWHNVYDFAEETALRKMAGEYLDLYWATWAEEQIDGIRGGGKTRIYQARASRTASGGGVREMAELYLGNRVEGGISAMDWVAATSGYRMPVEVMRLALDVDGRGSYEVMQRSMGLREDGWERTPQPPVIPFGITGLRSDFGGFLRYTYCTPNYVMGTLMCDARPVTDWSGSAAQNRWQGVIFRGHPDAAIVPECLAVDTHLNLQNHSNTMNQHWSVQKKETLITQKLACPEFSYQTGDSRVWFSRQGLSEPVEQEGWVFVEADGAYAAVCVVEGGYTWDDPEDRPRGCWLRCTNDLSPIVFEVSDKEAFGDLGSFQAAVAESNLEVADGILQYQGISGDRFTFFTDYSAPPKINSQTVDYAPSKVYDSPFLQSDWDSGVITISYAESTRVLDFNE